MYTAGPGIVTVMSLWKSKGLGSSWIMEQLQDLDFCVLHVQDITCRGSKVSSMSGFLHGCIKPSFSSACLVINECNNGGSGACPPLISAQLNDSLN